MKTSELRIGNIIELPIITREYDDHKVEVVCDGGVGFVLELKKDFKGEYILNSRINIKDTKPVPLTKEWLLKLIGKNSVCNIVPVKNNAHGLGSIKKRELINEKNIEWNCCGIEIRMYVVDEVISSFYIRVNNCNYDTAKCTYVHQLQNLYFALTGEELILK